MNTECLSSSHNERSGFISFPNSQQINKQTLTSYGLQCCSSMQQEWSNWILPLNFAHSENFKNFCLRDQNSNKLSSYIRAINYGPKERPYKDCTYITCWQMVSLFTANGITVIPFPFVVVWRADYDKFNNNVRQAIGWFECLYAGTEEKTKIFFYDLLKVLSTGWSVKSKPKNFKLSIIWNRYRRMW